MNPLDALPIVDEREVLFVLLGALLDEDTRVLELPEADVDTLGVDPEVDLVERVLLLPVLMRVVLDRVLEAAPPSVAAVIRSFHSCTMWSTAGLAAADPEAESLIAVFTVSCLRPRSDPAADTTTAPSSEPCVTKEEARLLLLPAAALVEEGGDCSICCRCSRTCIIW